MAGDDRERQVPVGRGGEQPHGADLVRAAAGELVKKPQGVARWRVQHHAAKHFADRVKPVLEGCDHAEVRTAAAHAPEQLRVLALAGAHVLALGGHQRHREQVVAGQAIPAGEPAIAAAEREPGDAHLGGDAHRGGEAIGLRVPVELAQRKPGLSARRAPLRIDLNALHRRKVDHQTAVTHAVAGDVVAAAAHCHREIVLTSKAHAAHDVVGSGAPCDQGRALVDQPVPDHAGTVVGEIIRH